MSVLTVRQKDGRFTIGSGPTGGSAQTRNLPSFVRLSADANRIADRISDMIDDRYWRLEYCKLIAREGFAVLAQADVIAGTVRSGAAPASFAGPVDMARVRFACAHALAADGKEVAGLHRMRLFYRLRFVLSSLIAGSVWIWTLLRAGWGNRLSAIAPGSDLIAVYAEISNRTRHVLAAASQSGSVSGILVLGRPGRDLDAVKARFSSEFGLDRLPVCRPIGFRSALRSMPGLFGHLLCGMRMVSATGFRPCWKDEIAILYRLFFGACAHEWWDLQAISPGMIVYGQSGLADSSLLEDAQKRSGAATVHWVHGLSGGWNFAGYSDLGLFKCGHDAEMHSRLPDYGRTDFVSLPKVPFRAGRGGTWLLMTNYAHPSNPYSGHGAYDLEVATVLMAAKAAREAGAGSENLVWRPHPVFWSLPEPARERILASVGKSGVRLPSQTDEVSSFAEYQNVLCTPSTAAVELVAQGVLPIIVAPHPIAPETAYHAFPLRAADTAELVDCVGRLADRSGAVRLFDQLWERIKPGHPAPTIADISARLDPRRAQPTADPDERILPPTSP